MIKYYPHVNLNIIGFYIQKVEILREKGRTHIVGKPKTLCLWGSVSSLDKEQMFRKDGLVDTLDEAVACVYSSLDKLIKILKERKNGCLSNIKIAKEVLREEKTLAKEASRTYAEYSNRLSNIDVHKLLERNGIVDG